MQSASNDTISEVSTGVVSDPTFVLSAPSFVPDVPLSSKPVEGMRFKNIDDAYDFYCDYAKLAGFSVRRGSTYNHDHKDKGKWYVCSKEGFKSDRKKDYDSSKAPKTKSSRARSSIRCGCKAHISYTSKDGIEYIVHAFREDHNHEMVSPEEMHLLTSNRKLSYVQEQLLFDLGSLNLGPVKAFNVMRKKYGGFEEVGATATDCKNFKRDLNCYIGEYDAEMIVRRLLSKKEFLPDYSFEYSVDADGTLTGLFWADEQCKANYMAFGDVVSFDATYNTNKYKLIFVPFTGIDNHHRNVTFGAGLISSEKGDTYVWLLQMFVKSFGKAPKVVVTDQDASMRLAIEKVLPDSRHRLCMWHIMKKVAEKVGVTLCNDEKFKDKLCGIVWTDSISEELFESQWQAIIAEFELLANTWLSDMYKLRKDWIPAFYRDEPMSGLMRTTSRSESENHFFAQVKNTQLTLVEFFIHYDTSLEIQRHNHLVNDYRSKFYYPDLRTENPLEEEAARIYTRSIFNDVQEEIFAVTDKVMSFQVLTEGEFLRIFIKDYEATGEGFFEVLFRKDELFVECSCKRFERYGLLCRHIFYVLKFYEVKVFPQKYVHSRWRRGAVGNNPCESASMEFLTDDNSRQVNVVVREIMRQYETMVDRFAPDLTALMFVRDEMKALMKKAEENFVKSTQSRRDRFRAVLGYDQPTTTNVRINGAIKTKGRCSQKRVISQREKAITVGKRKNACGICGVKGHNKKSCKVLQPPAGNVPTGITEQTAPASVSG